MATIQAGDPDEESSLSPLVRRAIWCGACSSDLTLGSASSWWTSASDARRARPTSADAACFGEGEVMGLAKRGRGVRDRK